VLFLHRFIQVISGPSGLADGHQQSIADRQERHEKTVVIAQGLAELARGDRRGVLAVRSGSPGEC